MCCASSYLLSSLNRMEEVKLQLFKNYSKVDIVEISMVYAHRKGVNKR